MLGQFKENVRQPGVALRRVVDDDQRRRPQIAKPVFNRFTQVIGMPPQVDLPYFPLGPPIYHESAVHHLRGTTPFFEAQHHDQRT